MRILWSIHLYPPAHNCGSEYVAHHVNKYLISKGHECRVILHRYNGPMYTYEGVEVFPASGSVDAFRWANIVATHLDFTQFTILMAREAKRPLVHFVHNDIEYASIKSAHHGQAVVYNSRWIADKIKYPWPSITLHPPCDFNYYNVNEDPINNEYIALISLNERKGGYMFKKIAEAMPGRKFLGVIGSYDNPGSMKLSQESIVAMMPPNVTIVPNSPDILSVYKKTRLLLMPSDYESWGRTATEAMCNGIPVICTPTDGLKENCGDAADYVGYPIPDALPGEASVKIGNTGQWVDAILRYDDPVYYREKSVLCRERARELDPLRELEALESFLLNVKY
jgi:glycosyltransferase involved in cell wall biosynthesis